jgi:biopolymer transport protein ExbD
VPYSPPERVEFKKKETASPKIPTASMPDIVFMLLLFFMVTTVFKTVTGLNVFLPSASKIEKLPGKRNVAFIWVDKQGQFSIDDKLVELSQIAPLMYNKRVENPRVVVSLKIDQAANMEWVNGVHQQLREADALNINYSAKFGE